MMSLSTCSPRSNRIHRPSDDRSKYCAPGIQYEYPKSIAVIDLVRWLAKSENLRLVEGVDPST